MKEGRLGEKAQHRRARLRGMPKGGAEGRRGENRRDEDAEASRRRRAWTERGTTCAVPEFCCTTKGPESCCPPRALKGSEAACGSVVAGNVHESRDANEPPVKAGGREVVLAGRSDGDFWEQPLCVCGACVASGRISRRT